MAPRIPYSKREDPTPSGAFDRAIQAINKAADNQEYGKKDTTITITGNQFERITQFQILFAAYTALTLSSEFTIAEPFVGLANKMDDSSGAKLTFVSPENKQEFLESMAQHADMVKTQFLSSISQALTRSHKSEPSIAFKIKYDGALNTADTIQHICMGMAQSYGSIKEFSSRDDGGYRVFTLSKLLADKIMTAERGPSQEIGGA
jgi:hypothetical protein